MSEELQDSAAGSEELVASTPPEESPVAAEGAPSQLVDGGDASPRTMPGREVPISALVHLLGLPTSSELTVIESKLDMLNAKISSIGARVDRLSQQIGTLANEFYIDRIDFQISEIRTLMKKVFPHVVRESDFTAGSLKEKKGSETKESEESTPSPAQE